MKTTTIKKQGMRLFTFIAILTILSLLLPACIPAEGLAGGAGGNGGGGGTVGAGVYKFDGKKFTNITTADHLAGNTVFSMLEDNSGIIWFGTDQGLSSYRGCTFINYTTHQGLSGNLYQHARDRN